MSTIPAWPNQACPGQQDGMATFPNGVAQEVAAPEYHTRPPVGWLEAMGARWGGAPANAAPPQAVPPQTAAPDRQTRPPVGWSDATARPAAPDNGTRLPVGWSEVPGAHKQAVQADPRSRGHASTSADTQHTGKSPYGPSSEFPQQSGPGAAPQGRPLPEGGHGLHRAETQTEARGIRIRISTVEFVMGAAGIGKMFDKETFRVVVGLGTPPPQYTDRGQATRSEIARYSKSVDAEGRYSTRVVCAFDQVIDIPWPTDKRQAQRQPDKISADIWLEQTGGFDRLDGWLDVLGIGSDTGSGAKRLFIGRAVADRPPVGVNDGVYPWTVQVPGSLAPDVPVPKSLALGVEWVLRPLAT